MKKSLAVVSTICMTAFVMAATGVFADDSTPAASSATSSSKSTKSHKKKKASVAATPQATPQPTVQATVQNTPVPAAAPKTTTVSATVVTSTLFSGNGRLYDRVGAPGDLQKAVAAAARAIGSNNLRHDKSVFLWLGRVTNGDDNIRNNAYLRFSLEGVAFAGPKKPALVLTGTVFDQSGSDYRSGDQVEVAVDFRDIKVDYEGTKMGEVNKGNDIADQVFDILNSHPAYQWVLVAQDNLRDPSDSMGMPTFVVKAQDGYAFLQAIH